MITSADYVLIAYVGSEQYRFEYEDCGDMWEALEQFWHEDYEVLNEEYHTECFAVDVVAMEYGKAIKRYEVAFDASIFHYFYDHGRITLNEFSDAIRDVRAGLDAKKEFDNAGNERTQKALDLRSLATNGTQEPSPLCTNAVTSFMYYMWNAWSEEECKVVFKDPHFWSKWCEAYDTMKGPRGAAELFYMMLSDTNRDKLVARALEMYDGMTEKH